MENQPECPYCASTQVGVGASLDHVDVDKSPEPYFRVVCQECGASGPRARSKEESVKLFLNRYGFLVGVVRLLREMDIPPFLLNMVKLYDKGGESTSILELLNRILPHVTGGFGIAANLCEVDGAVLSIHPVNLCKGEPLAPGEVVS